MLSNNLQSTQVGSIVNTAFIVDDDPAQRILLQSVLMQLGLKTKEFENGALAVEKFQEFLPDIILMDVKMPVMNGIEACARIRELPKGRDTPIVLITGLDDHNSIQGAFKVDATDFITKPVNWEILNHRIEYLLKASNGLKALRRSESHLINAQKIAVLGSWEYDLKSDVTQVSEQVYNVFGDKPSAESERDFFLEMVHPEDIEKLRVDMKTSLSEGKSYDVDYRIKRKDGKERIIHEQAKVIFNAAGDVTGLYGTVQDITDRKLAEEKIRHLAFYDTLTELPNRELFKKNAQLALENAKLGHKKVAIMFIDLDNFKRVNDVFGHDVGDLLLQKVSKNLMEGLRVSDYLSKKGEYPFSAKDSISRLGGDEFTLLLNGFSDQEQVKHVAKRIYDKLCQNVMVDGHDLVVTGSIGIAIYPDNGNDLETLLKNADIAMYDAKRKGNAGFTFYNDEMMVHTQKEIGLEVKLRRALESDHLVLYYQPQISSASGKIMGVEALIRWLDPEVGLIPPNDFIPLAERCDLIFPIGEWVLKTACHQAADWVKLGIPRIKMGVNISSKQFALPELPSIVKHALNESGLAAEYLELEITENSLVDNMDEMRANLDKLKKIGVSIAIDDFGTGYSSLSYLKTLPIDTLKIDKHFVDGITESRKDDAIIKAIIDLATSLKLNTIAEGVELESQLLLLKKRGCKEIQGYFYSKPIPAEEIPKFFKKYS